MMGTIYYVGCRTCNVKRDLDKLTGLSLLASNRREVLKLASELKSPANAFRVALLASFMYEHLNHDCVMFNEHSEDIAEQMEHEKGDWWAEPPKPSPNP